MRTPLIYSQSVEEIFVQSFILRLFLPSECFRTNLPRPSFPSGSSSPSGSRLLDEIFNDTPSDLIDCDSARERNGVGFLDRMGCTCRKERKKKQVFFSSNQLRVGKLRDSRQSIVGLTFFPRTSFPHFHPLAQCLKISNILPSNHFFSPSDIDLQGSNLTLASSSDIPFSTATFCADWSATD